MQSEKKQEKLEIYLKTIQPVMEELVKVLLEKKPQEPADIIDMIKEWCIENEKKIGKENGNQDDEESSLSEADVNEDDEVCDILTNEEIQKKKKKQKYSVSAEVYGQFNQKAIFIPKVIPKTEEQKSIIRERVSHAFMFSALDERDLKIIIDAFDEKKFNESEKVIQQGEDGNVLYLVQEGTLDCSKVFNPEEGEKFLKTYGPGDTFGELALLYNAPRAATITAKTASILLVLDRETFNNIVKDAAQQKRESYEKILTKIEILQDIDLYERNQIADALQRKEFVEGEYIVKEGDKGDCFYFLEDGKVVATKKNQQTNEEEVVYEYQCGDYFGELALLRQQPRAASILAKTNGTVCSMDRESFRRLLGPLEDLLKRNFNRYTKFVI